MTGRDRALLDNLGKCPFVLRSEHRARTGGLAVQQAVGSLSIEPQHPVPNRLQPDAADPRRFVSRAAIVNHRQRQQTSNLVRMPAQTRQPHNSRPVKITPQPYR